MKNETCWIEDVDYDAADENLKRIYDSVRSPSGLLDNLYRAFGLRAHTIKPADALYRAALHDSANSVPTWFSELIGTYVALLTGCEYASTHHGHNFTHLLGDPERAAEVLNSLRDGQLENCGNEREVGVLRYVKKLCLEPGEMAETDVATLSRLGWSDGEILEIVQVVAMFSYFVRVINGIGISLGGERVGSY